MTPDAAERLLLDLPPDHPLAEAVEKLGYRTLVVTDLLTGEVDERAGSDPVAWASIKAGAGANRLPMVAAIERLLAGETLRTKAYSWRLA